MRANAFEIRKEQGERMHSTMTVTQLRECAEAFVRAEPGRRGIDGWWRPPLLATAAIDQRFEALPRIAASDHLHPRDLLPAAQSVIVFFIPFRKALVQENQKGARPCRNWGEAYVQTNDLIGRLSQALADRLAQHGFPSALTPATHNFDEVKLMARWSHKHLAHLIHLGRFGTHHMLITPAGCAGRLGSLVSAAALGDHPLIETAEACLLKAGQKCGRCIQACPVAALSAEGLDRQRCWNRLKQNRDTLEDFKDLPETTHVCGKCAALMPCSFKNPVPSP
ncbi:MAG: epoxyqueuosine reductase [Desulfobacterales bacterium]|nr:MAG: epoxyqueuosine reductase [Desulfobacterales bacterium]